MKYDLGHETGISQSSLKLRAALPRRDLTALLRKGEVLNTPTSITDHQLQGSHPEGGGNGLKPLHWMEADYHANPQDVRKESVALPESSLQGASSSLLEATFAPSRPHPHQDQHRASIPFFPASVPSAATSSQKTSWLSNLHQPTGVSASETPRVQEMLAWQSQCEERVRVLEAKVQSAGSSSNSSSWEMESLRAELKRLAVSITLF
jgi:hypothetical protein